MGALCINTVMIGGYLTRDPELRYTPKGTAVAADSLALNRTWKDEAGQERQEVSFIEITAFGRTAEVLARYLRKGDPLIVEGRLKQDTWQDKQTQAQRSKVLVLVERLHFLGAKSEKPAQDERAGAPMPRAMRAADQKPAPATDAGNPDAEDTDVPF